MERRLQPPRDIIDFVRGFNELVLGIDSVIREIDITLRSLDGVLRMNPVFELPPLETRQEVPSPSFPGQTAEDYCYECLTRHYEKALGLLDEAHRFSLSAGKITEGAREKIRKAFHEIVTSEDDLGTRVEDPDVKANLDEIRVKVREFRKWLWASGLLTHETDVRKLEEAINRFKAIVDLTWKGAEIVASKRGGRCPYCELIDVMEFFEMLCSRIGEGCMEIVEGIRRGEISAEEGLRRLKELAISRGLTEDDIMTIYREAVRRRAERLGKT